MKRKGGGSQIKTSDKRSPPTRKALSAYGTQGGERIPKRRGEKDKFDKKDTVFPER